MPAFTKLVSLWAFVGLVALLTLQANNDGGFVLILLSVVGLSGLLLHGFLIGLLVEAYMRRVPRFLMIIPIIAYGAYYAVYFYQWNDIRRISAELRASNPGKIFDFDPASHSPVATQAEVAVRDYAIPVAYEENRDYQPEGYLSFRLVRRDQCDNVRRDRPKRVLMVGVLFEGSFHHNVCILRFPEVPPFKIVRVDRLGNNNAIPKWGVTQRVNDLVVDGVVVGSFRTASVWRLPLFPFHMIFGCMPANRSEPFRCGAELYQTLTDLDTVPGSVDRRSYDSPISVMLALRKYTASDLAGFRGYAVNDETRVRIRAEPGTR
jgi:hypothetical protein